jgi:hypothetical protein
MISPKWERGTRTLPPSPVFWDCRFSSVGALREAPRPIRRVSARDRLGQSRTAPTLVHGRLLHREPAWYAVMMSCSQRGSVDWSALAALAACVTAVAAMVVTITTVSQVRQETQRVLFNAGLDSLWHFDAQWNSDEMMDARSAAAAALLDGRPSHDIDEVLDFFDQVALLLKRGALDEELVSYEFYWPMANYWFASQEYIRQVQRDAPAAWEQLAGAVPRLAAIEAQRRKHTSEASVPTRAQIAEFLAAEAQNGECAEDETETRKTPL